MTRLVQSPKSHYGYRSLRLIFVGELTNEVRVMPLLRTFRKVVSSTLKTILEGCSVWIQLVCLGLSFWNPQAESHPVRRCVYLYFELLNLKQLWTSSFTLFLTPYKKLNASGENKQPRDVISNFTIYSLINWFVFIFQRMRRVLKEYFRCSSHPRVFCLLWWGLQVLLGSWLWLRLSFTRKR